MTSYRHKRLGTSADANSQRYIFDRATNVSTKAEAETLRALAEAASSWPSCVLPRSSRSRDNFLRSLLMLFKSLYIHRCRRAMLGHRLSNCGWQKKPAPQKKPAQQKKRVPKKRVPQKKQPPCRPSCSYTLEI